MENLVEVILRLRDEASGALRQVAQAAEQARQRIGSLSDNLAQVSHGLQGLGSSLGAILGTAGLTYALKSAADTAFQARAAIQSLSVAAAQAGTSLEEVLGTLDPLLDRLGILPEQASGAVAMLLRAGFSVEQIAQAFEAGAASALAAGRTAAEGIENVAMALATGQSIYLNYIGIAENIGPVLQKVASSMKGASEEAIKAAQNQAALNVILRATAGEVAALPAFLEGYVAAQNRLNASLYEFRTAIGNAVLPYLTALYDLLAEGVEWFGSLDDSTKRAIGTGAVAAAGILGLGTAMGLLLPVAQNAITVFRGLAGTLLALAANPVTLVTAGAAYLAVAWAKSAETVEESRKRFALLGQTLMGLYDLIKGVFQSIVGLLSSVGQIFATIARAFVRVVQGDFRGAWEEVQRGLNLEAFAAKFEAANQSLVRGWSLLGKTLRGEVSESAMSAVQRVEELVDRVNASLEAARKANNAQIDLGKVTKGTATAFSEAASAAESASGKVSRLTDAVDVLRKRYELGDLTLAQYLQSLQALLSKWEPHLKGLKAGTEEWRRYADAVLAARQAIEDATRSHMSETEAKGVEGWRIAILDTIRLGSTAYGRLMDQISALEARLARGGLSAKAEAELRDILEVAQRTAREWENEIFKALESESEEKLALAQALGEGVGEAMAEGIAEGIAEGFSPTQNALVQRIQEELELKLDIPGGILTQLDEDLAAVRAAALTGVIPTSDLPQLLSDIADRAEQMARNLYEAGELSASAFLQVWERVKRVREEVGALSQPPEWETTSELLVFLKGIPSEAEAALQTVRDLAYVMGPNELGEVIAANIAYLQELQAQVPPLTREYQILDDAIGKLRGMYLDLLPTAQAASDAITAASDAITQAAPDYIDVAGAARMWTEQLEELRQKLRDGSISTEEFASQAEEIRSIVQAVLPAWDDYLRSLEEQGVATEEAREALARLNEALAQIPGYLQAVKRERLDAWANDLASAIRTAANATTELSNAFGAQTIGGGISHFARGVSGILSLIPGIGQGVAAAVGVIGDALGSVVDGILNMLDSGWGKVQDKLKQAGSALKLVDPAILQRAAETYTESYLFGLIRTTKYRVNEALLQQIQEAARTAENAVQGGLQAALNAAARGEDWREAMRQSLYQVALQGVTQALMQSEAIRAALGPLTTALAEAILSGNTEAIAAATAALAQGMEALAPLFESLGQALGEFLPRQLSEAQKSIRNLTASLEGGITGAVKSALQAGLRGEDWQAELSSRIREGILSAVVDTAVSQAVVQGALGPLIDGMVEAILTADWQSVSVLSDMISTQTEVLVDGLLQGMHPLVSALSDLSQSATRASESLERMADSAANLPSWYRLDVARERAERVVVVNVQGSIYGIDDLRRALAEAERVERSAYGRW